MLSYLKSHGASFFSALHEGSGGGFPGETVDALWDLVWKGLVTNDTLHALRAYVSETSDEAAKTWAAHAFQVSTAGASDSGRPMVACGRAACVEVLRDGVEHRDREPVARTSRCRHARNDHARTGRRWLFDRLQVLKAMEDAGRVRRGYFVAGLGAAQFAMPAALDLLRSLRDAPEDFRAVVLSATDRRLLTVPREVARERMGRRDLPASGPGRERNERWWPGAHSHCRRSVIVVDGYAGAYLRRGERELLLFMPSAEPTRSHATQAVARALIQLSAAREEGRRGLLLAEIDGLPASIHPAARLFVNEGFLPTAMGLQLRHASRDGFGIRDSGFGVGTGIERRRRRYANTRLRKSSR